MFIKTLHLTIYNSQMTTFKSYNKGYLKIFVVRENAKVGF